LRSEFDISRYATEQVSARLGKLAYQLHSAARHPNADAVHDLRVAMRRFAQSVEVFSSVLPRSDQKKIRKKLKRMMEITAAIRDRDITLEFLSQAGFKKSDALWKQIVADRKAVEKDLAERIKRWSQRDFSAKWRSALQLDLS